MMLPDGPSYPPSPQLRDPLGIWSRLKFEP